MPSGSTLVYHQDRLTMIHEESCQSRVKNVASDLLPEVKDSSAKEGEESKNAGGASPAPKVQ